MAFKWRNTYFLVYTNYYAIMISSNDKNTLQFIYNLKWMHLIVKMIMILWQKWILRAVTISWNMIFYCNGLDWDYKLTLVPKYIYLSKPQNSRTKWFTSEHTFTRNINKVETFTALTTCELKALPSLLWTYTRSTSLASKNVLLLKR